MCSLKNKFKSVWNTALHNLQHLQRENFFLSENIQKKKHFILLSMFDEKKVQKYSIYLK